MNEKLLTEDVLLNLHDQVADHLEQISKLFLQRPKITIIIRTPWLSEKGLEGDVLLTDDDLDSAIAAINRLRNKPLIGEGKLAKH